jgi:hypothetical protein
VEECLLFQEYEKYCDGLAPWAAVENGYWARVKREEERIAAEGRRNNSVTSVHWMGPSEYFADPVLIGQAAERAAGEEGPDGFAVERRLQCGFLRDIFNPFRPATILPVWVTWNRRAIPRLAQGIYEERAFDRLPVLADALEEAGCTVPEILAHCRQPGEHVRGCWVMDLILGKN